MFGWILFQPSNYDLRSRLGVKHQVTWQDHDSWENTEASIQHTKLVPTWYEWFGLAVIVILNDYIITFIIHLKLEDCYKNVCLLKTPTVNHEIYCREGDGTYYCRDRDGTYWPLIAAWEYCFWLALSLRKSLGQCGVHDVCQCTVHDSCGWDDAVCSVLCLRMWHRLFRRQRVPWLNWSILN